VVKGDQNKQSVSMSYDGGTLVLRGPDQAENLPAVFQWIKEH